VYTGSLPALTAIYCINKSVDLTLPDKVDAVDFTEIISQHVQEGRENEENSREKYHLIQVKKQKEDFRTTADFAKIS
jgi:hypothetical protein